MRPGARSRMACATTGMRCALADIGAAPVGPTRLGERPELWRDGAGAVHVMADRCPHRGAALSGGRGVHRVRLSSIEVAADRTALPMTIRVIAAASMAGGIAGVVLSRRARGGANSR